ncbi:hypothetical protein SLG_21870 [Sphingobium sp. SYK-6]|uniref:hypothetical protein n=1 Tax=Sphingobium sp. (strain NBRC 103272 / SYK-6) TaxID=627192 RepID=UPI00022770B6|nr:hypothetical protein [Sphingobium sp. SYK-6]BAK66862.1 hypothetical protein SLG_21870 [Sphingobium sp. SYK-6]
MTKAEKILQAKLNALVAHLDATSGPMNAASLSRSYGVDEARVTEILKRRGRYQHG